MLLGKARGVLEHSQVKRNEASIRYIGQNIKQLVSVADKTVSCGLNDGYNV